MREPTEGMRVMTRAEIITECRLCESKGVEVSTACARAIARLFSAPHHPTILPAFARGSVVSMNALSAAVSDAFADNYAGASDDERLMLGMLGTWTLNWIYVVCVDGSFEERTYSDPSLALARAIWVRAEMDAEGVDMPVSVMPFRRGEV
jgi:hypothetical protein